jgi:hypothetical protein
MRVRPVRTRSYKEISMTMKTIRAIGTVTTLIALTANAQANDCRTVFGKVTLEAFTASTDSPCNSVIGLCINARISGIAAGPIRGTYFFAPSQVAPGAGLVIGNPGDMSVVGDIQISTRRGTLMAEKLSLFDSTTGEAAATYDIYDGPFTGHLVAAGLVDLSTLPTTGSAEGKGVIWGRVCKNE